MTTRRKYTPAPWARGFGNFVYEGNMKGRLLATCEVDQGKGPTTEALDEAFANAALVARAPKLFESLQQCVSSLKFALMLIEQPEDLVIIRSDLANAEQVIKEITDDLNL